MFPGGVNRNHQGFGPGGGGWSVPPEPTQISFSSAGDLMLNPNGWGATDGSSRPSASKLRTTSPDSGGLKPPLNVNVHSLGSAYSSRGMISPRRISSTMPVNPEPP